MSEQDLELYLKRIDEGLSESGKKLLKEYALRDEALVESDENGNVVCVPARDILAEHPELRM